MSGFITYGVGAHEPIYHRLRTGNSSASEWQRWRQETSAENLDLLEKLGVSRAHIACSKGFGLEFEKPLIERAARFVEDAARRGIETSLYFQGFPVYYETFLAETPEAEAWLGRAQNGQYIPWGGQTFRRYMDPTAEAFWDYQCRLLEYILKQFRPAAISMDNSSSPPASYTPSSRESFRRYLREKFAGQDTVALLGIDSFDAVDLPRFDPIYYPPDAYRIVKDPLLQEWAYWRSAVTARFVRAIHACVQSLAPGVSLGSKAGCDGLRYNQLWSDGLVYEDVLEVAEVLTQEEAGWRPGAFEGRPDARRVVFDERVAQSRRTSGDHGVRVATDSRWWKILHPYGKVGHHGFWGEVDRDTKLIALAHNFAFSGRPQRMGPLGPLAAAPAMVDDIADVIAWGNAHREALDGRERFLAPAAVWRGTATLGFIRHQPVWEACAVEQMLYENHVPFTILLDGGLDRFLDGVELLILPGTQCVSDAQVERLRRFVDSGGHLLLLGAAGTRDERTRLRRTHAFADFFGGALPNLEYFGPPHWVPELDFSAMPERLRAACGKGSVTALKAIVPPRELDLTRDPYSPFRKVAPQDVVPPANEAAILAEVNAALGSRHLRLTGPRWTLCEYWRRGRDVVVGCANLHPTRGGGPLRLDGVPAGCRTARVHQLLRAEAAEVAVAGGAVTVEAVERFCAIELLGAGDPRRA